ncbi:MAG TPA: hypothetical protein VHV83_04150 [Armatimonadota bacterium]|nr:hypothetical protein [Armatimonadota bacterium]
MPDEATSAMGPSGEPGNANPPKADESRGLGGAGTEGKPGEPAGGVEPQIPEIAVPSDNQIEQVVNDIEQMPPARNGDAKQQLMKPLKLKRNSNRINGQLL